MYLQVYACIWIVIDKITINTTANLPKTAQQWTHHQQGHTGTLCSGKKLFIVHFSVSILLVVHWPNHGPGVDVEQGTSWAWGGLTIAWGALMDRKQPCCRASWISYQHINQNTYIYIQILSHTCKYIPDTYNTHTPKSYTDAQVRNSIILSTFSLEWNTCKYIHIHTYTCKYIHIHTDTITYMQIHTRYIQYSYAQVIYKRPSQEFNYT